MPSPSAVHAKFVPCLCPYKHSCWFPHFTLNSFSSLRMKELNESEHQPLCFRFWSWLLPDCCLLQKLSQSYSSILPTDCLHGSLQHRDHPSYCWVHQGLDPHAIFFFHGKCSGQSPSHILLVFCNNCCLLTLFLLFCYVTTSHIAVVHALQRRGRDLFVPMHLLYYFVLIMAPGCLYIFSNQTW